MFTYSGKLYVLLCKGLPTVNNHITLLKEIGFPVILNFCACILAVRRIHCSLHQPTSNFTTAWRWPADRVGVCPDRYQTSTRKVPQVFSSKGPGDGFFAERLSPRKSVSMRSDDPSLSSNFWEGTLAIPSSSVVIRLVFNALTDLSIFRCRYTLSPSSSILNPG